MDDELLEEIGHHEALLRVQRRNLRVLELQAAGHGPFDIPLPIQSALSELRVEVIRIERKLLALRAQLDAPHGMIVAEHPAAEAQITFLATADLAATARFYGETLGLTLALEQTGCRVYQVLAGAYLGFCQVADELPAAPDWPIITIATADVAGWYAHLMRRGVAIIEASPVGLHHEHDRFFARDPNGYRIEVCRKDGS
jgi:catechol 2,3-dioxygenase-like lactoylglutathione lyase family enzyme